jgi:hypothetical protein
VKKTAARACVEGVEVMATFYWWVDENSANPGVIQSAESEKNEWGKH